MRSFIILFLVATIAVALAEDKPHYDLEKAPELFEKFVKDFNKVYKDDNDREVHYKQFVKSLETVNELNANPDDTASYGINHFSDYTPEERKHMYGLLVE
ncbi:unnamed protein product [Leptosia nina]|uniref:Cathepsin propeptide inhibitor domain-containing protein n=1 Tax=Leptosia nina TaxID=320188 RepID=A0AAV1JF74_9NEOP